MFAQIFKYLVIHKLLSLNQFGFQASNSTESALLTLLHKIYSCINLNQIVIAIFLDYSKAFDTISHVLLSHKLKYLFHFSNNAFNSYFLIFLREYNTLI